MLADFIFSSGIWIGEGKITFSTSPEFIKFYTKWEISDRIESCIQAKQIVEMQGIKEKVINHFIFTEITDGSFTVFLESESMGRVKGHGTITPTHLSWQIQTDSSSNGLETYELQEDGTYRLHAVYQSTEQYQTIIDGLIWKKGI